MRAIRFVVRPLRPAEIAVSLLVMLVLLLGAPYCALRVYWHVKANAIERLQPGSDMTTVADFVSNRGSGYAFEIYGREGLRHYVAKKRPPEWMLPSGQTCYVFDAHGIFVDWTWDNYDDPAWRARWPDEYKGSSAVTLKEVMRNLDVAGKESSQ